MLPTQTGDQVQSNFDVITRFYTTWDARPFDPSAVRPFVASGYIDHNRPQSDPSSTDGQVLVWLATTLAEGFPDGKHTVQFMESIGDDKVVVYWRFTGTQAESIFGIPAAGRSTDFVGMDVLRIENGQIVEHWHVEELAKMFAQLTGQG